MPLLQRNRGYSHWNPAHPEHIQKKPLGVPRLFKSAQQAQRAIVQWNACPNGRMCYSVSYSGEEDYVMDVKPDGRATTDLEVVAMRLSEVKARAKAA